MLNCSHLTKKYMSVTAVNDFNLQLEPGKIYALLGPNGSGKTTFMKIVAGLIKPTSGTISYDGEPIGVATKKRIAYMPTESYFYSYMSVKDIGKYYADFFADFDAQKYEKMIAYMQLTPDMKAAKMSSGMLAKLKLAVTLSRDSDLIMLDEPLNGIDIIARDQVISAIRSSVNGQRTIIMSSHLVDELEKMIDHAIFVKDGTVVLAGPADVLRREKGKSIVDLYREIYAYQNDFGSFMQQSADGSDDTTEGR